MICMTRMKEFVEINDNFETICISKTSIHKKNVLLVILNYLQTTTMKEIVKLKICNSTNVIYRYDGSYFFSMSTSGRVLLAVNNKYIFCN